VAPASVVVGVTVTDVTALTTETEYEYVPDVNAGDIVPELSSSLFNEPTAYADEDLVAAIV